MNILTPPRALLLDLDGTVLDTIELILFSYRHTIEAHCGHAVDDDAFRDDLGTPLRAVLERFAPDPGDVSAMVDTYRAHNAIHHDAMVSAYDGVTDVVDTARAAGMRLGVVTNKSRNAALKGLEVTGLAEHFATVITIDDVDHGKPHPEGIIRALAALDIRPVDAAFVGDSPHDVAAGRASGVRTAGALWGPFGRNALEAAGAATLLDGPRDIIAWLMASPAEAD